MALLEAELRALGLDPAQAFERAKSDEIKAKLKAATDEALERGAFGAPTFFVDGQMFVGNDRLDFVEAALRGTPAGLPSLTGPRAANTLPAMTTHRFTREAGALLVIDVQERLAAAMNPERYARLLNRTVAAIAGARALGLPIIHTEQYPKGLGPTVPQVKAALGGLQPVEKTEFSALLPAVKEQLTGRPNVLVTGMETHVCVFQTVRDLAAQGFTPYLASDAVLSRDPADHVAGLELCRQAGAVVTTVEAALFDALGKAGGPEFKAVSAAVK